MDLVNLDSFFATLFGIGGGSFIASWIIRVFIKKFLDDNEEKHKKSEQSLQKINESHKKAYQSISDKMSKLLVDIEVIKTRIGEVMSLKEDVQENSKNVVIALERIKNNTDDIDNGFNSIRKELNINRNEMSDLKRAKMGG